MFTQDMKESKELTISLKKMTTMPIFIQILEFLYTDESPRISLNSVMELFEAADSFGIDRLKFFCEQSILQNISVENAADILHISDMHNSKEMRQEAMQFVLSSFDEVSKTDGFT